MKTKPKISVVMPVYNAAPYLRQSIESILGQSYQDFEFLIIDDGSQDHSLQIIQQYSDQRLKVYSNEQNLGIIPTLNKGFELAQGTYIARMDADDISDVDRFQKQIEFMENHPEIDLCGTWATQFDEESSQTLELPLPDADIKAFLLWGNSIIHASVLIKKHFLNTYQLNFDPQYLHAEDYDLWVRCLSIGKFANLPETLYHIRKHSNSISKKNQGLQMKNTQLIYQRQLAQLGIQSTPQELALHWACHHGFSHPFTAIHLKKLSKWLLKLLAQNRLKAIYPETAFTHLLKQIWQKHTAGKTYLGGHFFKVIKQNPLSAYHQWHYRQKLKFWIKCMLKKG